MRSLIKTSLRILKHSQRKVSRLRYSLNQSE